MTETNANSSTNCEGTADANSVLERICQVKTWRKNLDAILSELNMNVFSRELSLSRMKIEEGIIWLGMELKRIGEENPALCANPCPHSKDPASPIIDKTADGLKL